MWCTSGLFCTLSLVIEQRRVREQEWRPTGAGGDVVRIFLGVRAFLALLRLLADGRSDDGAGDTLLAAAVALATSASFLAIIAISFAWLS
jgi:hypothetical protein